MSLSFLFGLSALCVLLCALTPARLRWILLLICSLGFYAHAGLAALPFLLLTALTTWLGSLRISSIARDGSEYLRAHRETLDPSSRRRAKARTRTRQRLWLVLVLLINFGLLALLKYLDPVRMGLMSLLSGGRPSDSLGLVIPLGISFYTFQATGYLLDVYNGKTPPERNPLRYLLFVSFFPQLIQGPISRYADLSPQLSAPALPDLEGLERGALLILWGFFKKKVLADRAMPFVNAVFDQPAPYGGLMGLVAVLLYSLQQYCDFSGGIDLVAGISEMLGIRLTPNFRRPYFSVSLADFWRRWHISLGSWMRDYVFYPFALSRPMSALSRALKGRSVHLSRALPAALGNLLVFLLVGIWHGARMNYVLWGLYNGILLALSALLDPLARRFALRFPRLSSSSAFHVFRILRTFLVVNVGWFFDRCRTGADALQMLSRIVSAPMPGQIARGMLLQLDIEAKDWRILGIGTALLLLVSVLGERGVDVRRRLMRLPAWQRFIILILFGYFVLQAFKGEGAGDAGFMYALF